MHLAHLIRTAAPEANLVAGVSLVLLVGKVMVLNRYPAQASGMYEFGVVVESVLSSVLASYAFYLYVVHFIDSALKH